MNVSEVKKVTPATLYADELTAGFYRVANAPTHSSFTIGTLVFRDSVTGGEGRITQIGDGVWSKVEYMFVDYEYTFHTLDPNEGIFLIVSG